VTAGQDGGVAYDRGAEQPGIGASGDAPRTAARSAGAGSREAGGTARGSATSRAAGATSRAAGSTSRATSRAARATLRRVRSATHAQGAGESGLARLIELHLVNAVGDALVAVALAGTLFFSVPSDEARGRVALYLLFTMAPFALVAPLVGPLLDRVRHGRRWAIGSTMAARCFLCWVMAGAIIDEGLTLYPAALLVLVASKGYNVARAAAVPRVLPESVELVTANSRIALAAIAGLCLGTPLGLLVSLIGPDWVLRLAFVVFVVGTVLSIRLPARVDSSIGEEEASVLPATTGLGTSGGRTRVGPTVVRALRGNAALRGFSGFLTLFLAFVLREQPVGGLSPVMSIAAVAIAAAAGSTGGTALMSALRARHPDRLVLGCLLLATVSATIAALVFGLVTVVLVALVAGLAQALAKLCLDAVIQRDVPEAVRTSAFARSETLLQLAWVVGGGIGIMLPLIPRLGMGLAAAALLVALIAAARTTPRRATGPPSPSRPPHGPAAPSRPPSGPPSP